MSVDDAANKEKIRRNAPVIGRRPGTLVLIGSGIKAINQFTLEAEAYLDWADAVYFCVADPATEHWITKKRPNAVDLYTLYDNDKARAITYVQMAELMLQSLRQGLNVVGIFHGHPGVFVNPSHRAIAIARQEGHEAFMLPAVSAMDCLFADLGIDPSKPGCQVIEASDLLLRRRTLLIDSHVIIFQVGSVGDMGFNFGGFPNTHLPVLVEYLQEIYGDDYEIVHYIAAQYALCDPVIERLPLSAFKDPTVSKRVTGISTFYVPPKVLRGVDPQVAATLGLSAVRLPVRDTVNSSPFFPSPPGYTKPVVEVIAQLQTHRPPAGYKPARPSAEFYNLVRELSLNPATLELFNSNPEALLDRCIGLSQAERRALLSRHYGYLRLAMQRTTAEVALEFVRAILRNPVTAQRYQILQSAGMGRSGHERVQSAIRELGFDTTPEDVSLALEKILSEDPTVWSGEYELMLEGRHRGRLSVSASEVRLGNDRIKGYRFADSVLTWSASDNNNTSGSLKFMLLTSSKDSEPLADGAYIGPQFRGVIWAENTSQPTEDNAFGKVGVFSEEYLSDPFSADAPEIWIGSYSTSLLSREASWGSGPQIEVDCTAGNLELKVDGKVVERRAYSNGNLSWVQAESLYSGSVVFYQQQSNEDDPRAEFIGRLWRGTEQASPVINAIGQRTK
jgi:Tetrapyrrole (Corrin/Porphyrin) Methylases